MDELDDLSMLEVFQVEAHEHLKNIARDALRSEGGVPGSEAVGRMMRELHTLKGAARLVDLGEVQRIAHALESRLSALSETGGSLGRNDVDRILGAIDRLGRLIDATALGEAQPGSDTLVSDIEDLGIERPPDGGAPTLPVDASAAVAPPPGAVRPAGPARDPAVFEEGFVRVPVDRLNQLLALSGEFHMARLRMARLLRQFQGLSKPLGRLDGDWRQAAALYADGAPQAITRFESLLRTNGNSSGILRKEFESDLMDLDELLGHLERLNQDLGQQVTQARMLPLGYLFDPFPRLVRDLAHRLGKQVVFTSSGADTKVDRNVLEGLREPLIHLLQNAIDHGLETPAQRIDAGKPEQATLALSAAWLGDVLVVEVTDDGRGVDYDAVRKKAIAAGLVSQERALRLGRAELEGLLFWRGFSTAGAVTPISGRGVGLDAVKAAVESLHGDISLVSRPGGPTTFSIRLPLSMAVTRVMLARAAGTLYAFPIASIHRLTSVRRADVSRLDGVDYIVDVDSPLRLARLADALGVVTFGGVTDEQPAMVLADKGRKGAITVDRFVDEEDIIVKVFDPRIGKLRHLLGAAVTRSGELALVVDTPELLLTLDERRSRPQADARSVRASDRQRVLIVEDSRTSREVARRILVSAGYEVVTAADGLEALDLLNTSAFDLVLTDVTMPGLDGFGLARRIRADPRLHALPVVMLSFKDRDEDRKRGLAAGASAYLIKEQFDHREILRTIAVVMEQARSGGG